MVRHHKTRDGATVAEVLAYVQMMRPRRFRTGSIEIGYNGATGAAAVVAIGYWIGAKRLPGDSFVDLGYDMNADGSIKPVAPDQLMLVALEDGRDLFLQAVDEVYESECRPDADKPPSC